MKTILVSPEDEDLLQLKWSLDRYPVRARNGKTTYLHKVIAKRIWPDYEGQVDHKNLNKYDCRRDNLRQATQRQNLVNRPANRGAKYKGVRCRAAGFQAIITLNKKQQVLGTYRTPEEAALWYNVAAAKYHGEFAYLNVVHEG